MHLFRSRSSRRAAVAAATLAGAATLFMAAPSRGQQNEPSVRFGVGAASRGHRRVDTDFTLPPGLKLAGLPRVKVFDAQGRLVELWRMYLLQRTPAFRAYQNLAIKNYPLGFYQVHIEIDYILPNGTKRTFATTGTAMIVPPR